MRVMLLVRAIPIFTTESSTVIIMSPKMVILTMSSKRVKPWLFIFWVNLMMIVNERIERQRGQKMLYQYWLLLGDFSMILVIPPLCDERGSKLYLFQISYFPKIMHRCFPKFSGKHLRRERELWWYYFASNYA